MADMRRAVRVRNRGRDVKGRLGGHLQVFSGGVLLSTSRGAGKPAFLTGFINATVAMVETLR
jgi:hypothetical protein